MKISKVRDYTIQQVLGVDSDFKEWTDGFNSENIPSTLFNKAFHIFYTIPSIVDGQSYITNSVSLTLKLFFKGYRDPAEAIDTAMDTASDIVAAMKSIHNVQLYRSTDDLPIQNVVPLSQIAEPLENNDNNVIITMEFDMNIIQTTC